MPRKKYQCVKRRIEEKAFKSFLKIKKQGYLKKEPFDKNIEFKDCYFWIEYSYCDEFNNALYDDTSMPELKKEGRVKMDCWLGVVYPALLCVTKKGIKKQSYRHIKLAITYESSYTKPNRPKKDLFYLRLSRSDVELIRTKVFEHARACHDEMWPELMSGLSHNLTL